MGFADELEFQPQPNTVSSVTVEGLQDLFNEVTGDASEDFSPSIDGSLSLKEAVHYYNLPLKTIRAQCKKGELPALRVSGKKGLKWRVYPQGLPQSHLPSDDLINFQPPNDPIQDVIVDQLQRRVIELEAKLEAATYRVGYLQHNVETQEERIKLLQDKQAEQTWWHKLLHWAKG